MTTDRLVNGEYCVILTRHDDRCSGNAVFCLGHRSEMCHVVTPYDGAHMRQPSYRTVIRDWLLVVLQHLRFDPKKAVNLP